MLVAEYGDMTKPFVIITGHMDTVFNKGAASTRAFKIEDGKAYGPGVLDMKGGITIALFVLKEHVWQHNKHLRFGDNHCLVCS